MAQEWLALLEVALPSSPEGIPDGQEEPLMDDDVMIAVDPHKASNTAAVLDPVSKTVIDSARFTNSEDGYARLTINAGTGMRA